MHPGGRLAWWDLQDFDYLILAEVDYPCQASLGDTQTLKFHECLRASWEFIGIGEKSVETGKPLRYSSGESLAFLPS